MSVTSLVNRNNVKVTKSTRPSFMKTDAIKWTPWVIEGTHFKLLAVDVRSGGFTLMLKIDPGNDAPTHFHVGSAEGIILEGGFGYDDDRGGAGDYICEHAGVAHKPDSSNGCVMFGIMHGPLVGYNADGTIAAVVDAKTMYQLAKAAGQAAHIQADFEDIS